MAQLDIYNIALGRLRAKKATSTDTAVDTSRQAEACDREYVLVRNKALASFPWSFATQRIELEEYSEDDPAPLGVWVGRFKVFSSAQTEYNRIIKVVEVRSSDTGALLDYELTTDKDELDAYQQWIFATTTSKIVVTAVVEITDPDTWPEYFQDVVAWRLAEAIAVDLTDSVDKANRATTMATRAAAEARLIDLGQKRQVPRLRVRPGYSPRAARMGPTLAAVEGESPA